MKFGNQTKTKDYVGNMIYENGALKRILVDCGYVENNKYHFFIQNHLSINRALAQADETLIQTNHFDPCGTTFTEDYTGGPKAQSYKYNSKEFDGEYGLNLYDYLARSIDSLAEKFYSVITYVYCGNNPINVIDPDGRDAILLVWASHNGKIGHAGIAVSNYKTEFYKIRENEKNIGLRQVADGTYTYRDLWPGVNGAGKSNFDKDVPEVYNKNTFTLDELKNTDVTGSEGCSVDRIIQLSTDATTDAIVNMALDAHKKTNLSYNGLTNKCSDYAESGIEYAAGQSINADEKLTKKLLQQLPISYINQH